MGRPLLVLACAALVFGCADDGEPLSEVPALPYCEPVAAWEPAHAGFEREVLELVNQRRIEGADCVSGGEFLPGEPLTMDPALRCAARMHTLAMVEGDYFDHQSPEGEGYEQRAEQAGYAGEALGQTIAGGQRDPVQVVNAWMSNDGNCAELMNPEATQLGVGYLPAADADATHAHYWTQVFGRAN